MWPRSWTVSPPSTQTDDGILNALQILERLNPTTSAKYSSQRTPYPPPISPPQPITIISIQPRPPLSNQLTSITPGLRHPTPKNRRFPVRTQPTYSTRTRRRRRRLTQRLRRVCQRLQRHHEPSASPHHDPGVPGTVLVAAGTGRRGLPAHLCGQGA